MGSYSPFAIDEDARLILVGAIDILLAAIKRVGEDRLVFAIGSLIGAEAHLTTKLMVDVLTHITVVAADGSRGILQSGHHVIHQVGIGLHGGESGDLLLSAIIVQRQS